SIVNHIHDYEESIYIACHTSHLCSIYNPIATALIFTVSLHDTLPISDDPNAATAFAEMLLAALIAAVPPALSPDVKRLMAAISADRKSTRMKSSHVSFSYSVLCLHKTT